MKLTRVQQHYVQKSYIPLHQNWKYAHLDRNSLMYLHKAWLSLHQFNETCKCTAARSVPTMSEICQKIWK
jgi:hypothetical protein